MKEFAIRRAELCDVETLVQLRLEMRRERETAALTVPESEFASRLREYFTQAIEDGSTVPLFYSRRVPEVGLQKY